MILEKNGERGMSLRVLNMALRIKNHSPSYSYWYYHNPRLRKGHVSTAAVFSEYESFEWLFRETYKKAGCYVLGAKLLQFFETPKSLMNNLRTHSSFFLF